jgi:hypothetical protein
VTPKDQRRISLYPTEIQVRGVLRHHWIRVFISVTGECDPGHSWMYSGLVRRDAWVIRGYGFGVLRMPKRRPAPTTTSA